MISFLLSILIIIIAIVFHFSLRGTVFEFSLKRKRFGGLPMIREIFFLILLGALIFEMLGPEQFNTFYITTNSISETTPIVLFSVLSLILSLAIFSRTLFRRHLMFGLEVELFEKQAEKNAISLLHSVALMLVLLISAIHIFGGRHAFISSLWGETSLLQARLANVYETSGPAFITGYLRFSTTLLAILLGFFGRVISNKIQTLYFALMIYAATYTGDKAPLISMLFLLYVGRLSVANYRVGKTLLIASISVFLTLGLVFLLTKIQFPEMDVEELVIYIFGRLGVGQIQGVYEQFALRLHDFSYIVSEIPLSGMFASKDSFSKDLMMLTGAYGMNKEDIGVMSSFFIGEAFAIGGYALLYASPVFVAFNFCFLTFLIIRLLTNKIAISKFHAKRIGALFIVSVAPFTGDFGGLLAFKKLIAVIAYMIAVCFVFKILKKFQKREVAVSNFSGFHAS